jgi:uncharacterized protein (TIGR00369 family)
LSKFVAPPHGGTWQQWADWGSELSVAKGLNLRCTHVEAGRATLVLDGDEWSINPNGAVNGGIVIACADHAFGIVASTLLDPETIPATATFTSDFLRPAIPPITFEAVVDRIGRTMVFVSASVTDRIGKVCNQVRGTMIVDGSSRTLGNARAASDVGAQ